MNTFYSGKYQFISFCGNFFFKWNKFYDSKMFDIVRFDVLYIEEYRVEYMHAFTQSFTNITNGNDDNNSISNTLKCCTFLFVVCSIVILNENTFAGDDAHAHTQIHTDTLLPRTYSCVSGVGVCVCKFKL